MKWMFAAGGTGGHVFPALTMAKQIRAQYPQDEILFVGRRDGVEQKLLSEANYELQFIQSYGVNSKGLLAKVKGLLSMLISLPKILVLLVKQKPDIVFGIGGYLSGPVLLVASLFPRIKTGILEPNARPGMANILLSKFVDRIFIAFPKAKNFFPKNKTLHFGNPIRPEILAIEVGRSQVRQIFIFGGSQGAMQVNSWFMDCASELLKKYPDLKIVHQSGDIDFQRVSSFYQAHHIPARVQRFFKDVGDVYAQTDLAVARSGSSVLELCACGIPSILIPYPYAADNHQEDNALELEKIGAAIKLDSRQGSAHKLKESIEMLIEQPQTFSRMSESALAFRYDTAAESIVGEMRGIC